MTGVLCRFLYIPKSRVAEKIGIFLSVGHCENVSHNILCVADLPCVCVSSLVSPVMDGLGRACGDTIPRLLT